MAWVTGPHAEAPPNVICYGGEEPGTVTWFAEDEPPPPDTLTGGAGNDTQPGGTE